ncbi:hypothetical protein [Sphingobacterium detergens]
MEKYLKPIKYGVCQVCRCTDSNCKLCILRTGQPCYWVDNNHTFCSACLSENKEMRFLRFLRLDIDEIPFFSAMWYELDLGVDKYIALDVHERINNKIDFYYLLKENEL